MVQEIKTLPAGSYLLWAAGDVTDSVNDSDADCALVSGGATIVENKFDQSFPGISTREGSSSFALDGAVTLTAPGSVEVDCSSNDNSGSSFASEVSITAMTVDTVN
jgi:hypothetical protein